MTTEQKLVVSAAPHVHGREKIGTVMLDVLIALMPAAIAGAYFFGFRAILVMLVAVASCMAFEAAWQAITHQKITISDGSAAVTGLLLAFNLPVTVPLWAVVLGSLFAIIIVKQLFGGLGNNFMNPALAARAFLLASWIVPMTRWVVPKTAVQLFGANVDAVTAATPLAILKGTAEGALPSVGNLFLGNIGGCIGETSALAILIGGLYLVIRRVITLEIPLTYILTVGLMTWIFGADGFFTGHGILHMLSGGLFLGAFFMATDYTTSPVTRVGQYVMGIGCGLLTSLIRLKGGYPEGVTYAILLMNIMTPLIDRFTVPRKFGKVRGRKKA